MSVKKFLVILAMVATVAMVGCRTVSSEPPSSPTIPKETQEISTEATIEATTEAATETEKIVEATEPTEAPQEEPYDGFTLVNSPDFEPFEVFGEKHLQTILEREGIDGIDFFNHTKPETIKVGKIGDVFVGQVQMDDDDVVWNVRIEKADDFVNNTGIDMSKAENLLVDKDEIVSEIGGMTFITRKYRIDLVDYDELDASIEAGDEWNLSNAHSIEIRLFLNKTKSTLFTIYADVNWVRTGENSIGPAIKRDPIGMMKSDADYEMEAYEEELAKKTEELEKKFK